MAALFSLYIVAWCFSKQLVLLFQGVISKYIVIPHRGTSIGSEKVNSFIQQLLLFTFSQPEVL